MFLFQRDKGSQKRLSLKYQFTIRHFGNFRYAGDNGPAVNITARIFYCKIALFVFTFNRIHDVTS